MMLNERQKQIFLCLDENKNSFIKGIELANKVNCSLKTLQKGKNLKDMSLAEMDAIWDEAKQKGL